MRLSRLVVASLSMLLLLADSSLEPHTLAAQPVQFSQAIEWPDGTIRTFNLRRFEPIELAAKRFAWNFGPRNDFLILNRAAAALTEAWGANPAARNPPPLPPLPPPAQSIMPITPKHSRLGVVLIIFARDGLSAEGTMLKALLRHGIVQAEDVIGVECGIAAIGAAAAEVPVTVTVQGGATATQCVELGVTTARIAAKYDVLWLLSSKLNFDGSEGQLLKLTQELQQALVRDPSLAAVSPPLRQNCNWLPMGKCDATNPAVDHLSGCAASPETTGTIHKIAGFAQLGFMLSLRALLAAEAEGGSLVSSGWPKHASGGLAYLELFWRLRRRGWWVGCMAHGVRIVQSLSDMTSFDRAAAEWYLSGKFGSHWPELMGHDQAGTNQLRHWREQYLLPAVMQLPEQQAFPLAAEVLHSIEQATGSWRAHSSWQSLEALPPAVPCVWTFNMGSTPMQATWRALLRVALVPAGFQQDYFYAERFAAGRASLRQYPDYLMLAGFSWLHQMGYLNTSRTQNDVLSKQGWATFGAKVSFDRWKLRNAPEGGTVADSFSNKFVELIKLASGEEAGGSSIEGFFYYPQGSYREWHTNEVDQLGWRMYLVHTANDDCAWFRYRDPLTGKIYTSVDSSYTVRLFKVVQDNPLWHSIESECDRWSVGVHLNLTAQAIDTLLRWMQFYSSS